MRTTTRSTALAGLAMLAALAGTAAAQKLDLTRDYQILSRGDVKKLHGDLNKAGQNGIRVVTASFSGGDRIRLLLEKTSGEETYEYYIAAAGDMTKLEQQISHGGAQGYRVLPNTMTVKSKTLGKGDIVMIMEKGPRSKGTYEYLMLDATLPATLQVTLKSSIEQGYKVVGMFERGKRLLLILEKQKE